MYQIIIYIQINHSYKFYQSSYTGEPDQFFMNKEDSRQIFEDLKDLKDFQRKLFEENTMANSNSPTNSIKVATDQF